MPKTLPDADAGDLLVIGGGPAGLCAAAAAAEAGARATLLEEGERTGRKLLLTGRGRCNLSSTLPLPQFTESYANGGRFLRNVYSRFFSDDLVRFLAGIGVETAVERGGRIYPCRDGARGLHEALKRHVESSGVNVLVRHRVRRIAKRADGSFEVSGEDFKIRSGRVVVATGGASYPWTGSRGDGYRMAAALGHTIEPLRPALVPVRCAEPFLKRLAGLRLRNVRLSYRASRKVRTFFGEVHFTPFGISGPAVFPASREIGILSESGPLPLRIDLKPALDDRKLDARLLRELAAGGTRRLSRVCEKLLPRALVPVVLEASALSPATSAAQTSRPQRRRLLRTLKSFPLSATGTLPLERALVTSGGVRLREVEPSTLESRIVPGLFFCGEVLDVDGTTGGFNLQAAFSTGILAGRSAAVLPAEERPAP